MAKKSAVSKGYRKQTGKKPFLTRKETIMLCVIVAVLIIAFTVLLRYDDGALKLNNGVVVTEGDNWLIVNGNARGRNARYFKIGEAGDIDGYTRESQNGLYGANTPEYIYTPDDETSGAPVIGVSTYPNVKAADLADYYARTIGESTGLNNEVSDVQTAGGDIAYTWFSYTSQRVPEDAAEAASEAVEDAAEAASEVADEAAQAASDAAEAASEVAEAAGDAVEDAVEEEINASRVISAYIDAAKNGTVIVDVRSSASSLDACMSEEELRDVLNTAISALTLDTAK